MSRPGRDTETNVMGMPIRRRILGVAFLIYPRSGFSSTPRCSRQTARIGFASRKVGLAPLAADRENRWARPPADQTCEFEQEFMVEIDD